jgi:hypothetical protein
MESQAKLSQLPPRRSPHHRVSTSGVFFIRGLHHQGSSPSGVSIISDLHHQRSPSSAVSIISGLHDALDRQGFPFSAVYTAHNVRHRTFFFARPFSIARGSTSSASYSISGSISGLRRQAFFHRQGVNIICFLQYQRSSSPVGANTICFL